MQSAFVEIGLETRRVPFTSPTSSSHRTKDGEIETIPHGESLRRRKSRKRTPRRIAFADAVAVVIADATKPQPANVEAAAPVEDRGKRSIRISNDFDEPVRLMRLTVTLSNPLQKSRPSRGIRLRSHRQMFSRMAHAVGVDVVVVAVAVAADSIAMSSARSSARPNTSCRGAYPKVRSAAAQLSTHHPARRIAF